MTIVRPHRNLCMMVRCAQQATHPTYVMPSGQASLTKINWYSYILLFAKTNNPLAKLLKKQFLELSKAVVEQDTDILNKIYPNSPQKIKLNNEVGMDWVKHNFDTWE